MKLQVSFLLLAVSLAALPTSAQQSRIEDLLSAPEARTNWFDTSIYLPHGNGVKVGRPISTPDPEYSEYARKNKITGAVILAVAINDRGTVDDVKIARSLEPTLDQKAVEAVSKWKFTPATKDGRPVAVQIPVSVGFSLY